LGTHYFQPSLEEVLEFFDWSPFFWAWELKGTYPQIFERKGSGEEAKKLFDQAQVLLEKIIREKSFRCHAVVGLWPAHSCEDDVELFSDLSKTTKLGAFRFVRRQQAIPNQPQFCLSDYIAPKTSGRMDYLGAFAVNAGKEVDLLADHYKSQNDDFTSILIKSLGDRFAEATAEYAHKKIRDLWGFGSTEGLSNQDLIAEKYRGIRPAAGYPCQPDHTEKDFIWELLKVRDTIGLELTESRAMNPGCSVSGLYFSHPDARYFNVGSLGRDQVEDYAKRKGWELKQAIKWLRPNLGFDA
jgi:5-methyltetrahydrofolate--homocysteine methyltransferase